jgi:hypothetical protein
VPPTPAFGTRATLVARAPNSFENSPEEKHHDSTRHARNDDHGAVGLSTSGSLAQQNSVKDQLVGTWTLVSSDQVRPDGSKLKHFGANPSGINVFDANGRFFIMMARAGNIQIASNGRSQTIAYYGTYTVNEEVTVISLHLDASTFPNQVGTDQKRTITSLTVDELKYSSPGSISGVQIHQVWKRAQGIGSEAGELFRFVRLRCTWPIPACRL